METQAHDTDLIHPALKKISSDPRRRGTALSSFSLLERLGAQWLINMDAAHLSPEMAQQRDDEPPRFHTLHELRVIPLGTPSSHRKDDCRRNYEQTDNREERPEGCPTAPAFAGAACDAACELFREFNFLWRKIAHAEHRRGHGHRLALAPGDHNRRKIMVADFERVEDVSFRDADAVLA